MAGFYRQIGTRKEWITLSFLGEQKGSVRRITSLLLAKELQTNWFKITFLGEVETVTSLCIKSWFSDMVLSTSDSILGLFLFLIVFCFSSNQPIISEHFSVPRPWICTVEQCTLLGKIRHSHLLLLYYSLY